MEDAQLVANLIKTAVGVSLVCHGIFTTFWLSKRAAEAI